VICQAAHGARDRDLIALVSRCNEQTTAQLAWLRMRMKAQRHASLRCVLTNCVLSQVPATDLNGVGSAAEIQLWMGSRVSV
jgi:hypothetical protein